MWNILTPLMKKIPFMTAQRGGDLLSFTLKPGTTRDLEVQKPYEAVGICGPISVGCFDIPTPKKTALNPLVSWWFPKKTCLQNSYIKSFNPLIGPKKTVWNDPSSPFPSPGLPGVFVGVTLPESNIISYTPQKYPIPSGNFIFQPLILRVWAVSFWWG